MRRILSSFALFFCLAVSLRAQTTTPNLGLILPPTNATNWGVITNYNMLKIDTIVGAGVRPYQGNWSNTTTYGNGVLVTYLGTLYGSNVANNVGNNPASSGEWTSLSETGGMIWPTNAGLAATNGGATGPWRTPVLGDLTAFWSGSGACYLKKDGTCDTGSSNTLPISTYNLGSGECFLSDSTGIGDGTVTGGSGALIYANYNSQGCSGYEYPGSWYSNASGATNTGDATIGDVAAIEAYPNENPPDTGALDYYLQFGIGEALTCSSTAGFGTYSDCSGGMASGALTALQMWLGTPQHGKLLASNATQGGSGTWTAYNPAAAGDPPFRSGVAECGTTGATLSFTTMPASGALYLAWIVKNGGTDTATLAIDGASAGTLSSGVEGAWSTDHETSMWFGERFALPGSAAATHTAVITVTAGSFCPVFAVTPRPHSWDGMALPNLYQAGPLPGGVGELPDFVTTAAMQAVTQQMQADGLHVQWIDLWSGWPESAGATEYDEFQTGTYPNGFACTGTAGPHFNNCGDTFNAWTFLQTAGRVPQLGFVNSVFGRRGNVVAQAGDYTAAQVTNAAATNAPNTFNGGTQTAIAATPTSVPRVARGTSIPLVASVGTNGFANGGYSTVTVTVGEQIVALQSGSGSTLTDTLGNTWSVLYSYTSGAIPFRVFGTTITVAGTDTIETVNLSYFILTNAQLVVDAASVVSPASTWLSSASAGPITTGAGDILLSAMFANVSGTCNPSTPAGWTAVNNSDIIGGAPQWAGYFGAYQGPEPAGAYSVTYNANCLGTPTADYYVAIVAIKPGAGSTTQTADLDQWQAPDGTVSARVNAQGQYVPPSVAGMPTNSPSAGALAWNSSLSCLAVYTGSTWACVGGTSSPLTTKGDLYVFDTANTRLPVGADGTFLEADSTQSKGVKWGTPSGGGSSPLTTKGDLYGFSTVDARLGVGSDGKVLTANSGTSLGVDWETPSGGGSGATTNIGGAVTWSGCTYSAGACTVGTAVASVTISAIPGTYLDLLVDLQGSVASGDGDMDVQLNGDTTAAHYSSVRGAASCPATNNGMCASLFGSSTSTGGGSFLLLNYTSSLPKIETGVGFETKDPFGANFGGGWTGTAAVTSITIYAGGSGNIMAGAVFKIHGIS